MACKKELVNIVASDDETLVQTRSARPILDISYDIEVLSHIRGLGSNPTDLEIASAEPSVTKQSVDYQLHSDGTVTMTLENLTPGKSLSNGVKALPDPSVRAAKLVFDSGSLDAYDVNNNLLYSENLPFENLQWLVDTLKNNHNGQPGSLSNPFTAHINTTLGCSQVPSNNPYTMANMITWIQDRNGTVTNHGNGMKTLSISASDAGIPSSNEDITILIDDNLDLVLGNVVYSSTGDIKSSTYYRYGASSSIMEGMKLVANDTLPGGLPVEIIMETDISNVDYTINL